MNKKTLTFFNIFFAIIFSVNLFSGEVSDAVRSGSLEEVRKVLKKGADINEIEYFGSEEKTPLMIAADQMNVKMVKLLIEKKADINFKTPNNGTTAIMYICTLNEQYTETAILIMKMLLEAKAEINITDKNQWNAMMYAVYYKTDLLKIKFLIENKINLNHATKMGESALYIAAENGYADIVDLLIKSGSNAGIKKRENKFISAPIHIAVEKGYVDVVKAFLENKADVNIKTEGGFGGQTPLHKAVEARDVEMVKLILKYKPNVNIKDDSGSTPLIYATQGGGPELGEIISLLKKAGAK